MGRLFAGLCLGLNLLFHPVPVRAAALMPPVRSVTDAGRVVRVQADQAVEAFRPEAARVTAAVNRGIMAFTRKGTVGESWRSLLATNDTVGIKVNSAPGDISGTRPAVVAAVVEGLIQAGIPARQIIIWDKELGPLRRAGFDEVAGRFGVQLAGAVEAGYDEQAAYDRPLLGHLVYGDHEFGKKGEGVGRKSFVTKLLTGQITRLISIAPLINHNLAGVNGHLFSLAMGSVDNTMRFDGSARLDEAVPEIFAQPQIGDRVALCITDALICQYEGETTALLHYSSELNQLWFSKDPVALDVLGREEMGRQRLAAKMPPQKNNSDLFSNAALLELGVNDLKNIHVEER